MISDARWPPELNRKIGRLLDENPVSLQARKLKALRYGIDHDAEKDGRGRAISYELPN
jgi:hypothetical protein